LGSNNQFVGARSGASGWAKTGVNDSKSNQHPALKDQGGTQWYLPSSHSFWALGPHHPKLALLLKNFMGWMLQAVGFPKSFQLIL